MHLESSSTLAHASFPLINFAVCIFILINCRHEYNRFQWVLLENYQNWGWCWKPLNLLRTLVLCTGLFLSKFPCSAHYSKSTSWGNLQHSAVGPNCALVRKLWSNMRKASLSTGFFIILLNVLGWPSSFTYYNAQFSVTCPVPQGWPDSLLWF